MERPNAYDIDELRQRIPSDRSELHLGFCPWDEDLEGRVRTVDERVDEAPGRPLSRTVWDDPENRDSRLLIEIAERDSAEQAFEALVDRLEWNELARLPEGPPGLGYVSFVHPEGLPPAVYFIRANVCISAVSFGRDEASVLPVAARLDGRLADRPQTDHPALTIKPARPSAKAGEVVGIRIDLPFSMGECGFIKLFSDHATLTLAEGQPVLRVARAGSARVEAFAAEPGRETLWGSFEIDVD